MNYQIEFDLQTIDVILRVLTNLKSQNNLNFCDENNMSQGSYSYYFFLNVIKLLKYLTISFQQY